MRTEAESSLAEGVYGRLAEHYTDRLALNWRRRGKLLESPNADFAALSDWDARMDVAMEALHLLGPVSQQHMARCLESPINAGEAFAVLCHALRSRFEGQAEATAAIATTMPRLLPALVAALEWSEPGPPWHRLVSRLPLAARFDVIAARHRDAPGLLPPALQALKEEGPASAALASALRCLRHMGDSSQALAGLHHLEAADERVRRQAAQALLALAPAELVERAVDALLSLVRGGGSEAPAAARCLALHQPRKVLPILAELRASHPGEWTRIHVQALGWSGAVGTVPELMECLDSPAHARVAAAAIHLITGLDPVRDGWQGEALAPDGSQCQAADPAAFSADLPTPDPDAGLPWPSRERFAALWQTAQARFTGVQPHLGGRPATADNLRDVLCQGPLPWRPLVAARLQRLTKADLFPTRLPARLQATLLTA